MIKNIKLLLLLLGTFLTGFAQKTKPVSDINSVGSAFPFGTKLYHGDRLCFQAFDKNGNTMLYYMGALGLETIKKWPATDHAIFIHPVLSHGEQVLFGVVGDSALKGIWYWDGKMNARLLYPGGSLNEHDVLMNGQWLVNAEILGNEDHIFEVQGGKLVPHPEFSSIVENVAVDRMIPWGNIEVVSYREQLYTYDGKTLKELTWANELGPVSSPFVFKDKLYFNQPDRRICQMYAMETNGRPKKVADVCPNFQTMEPMDPLIGTDKVFFVSNEGNQGTELFEFDGKTQPKLLQQHSFAAHNARFTSYCLKGDNLFFCTAQDDENTHNMFQYSMDTLIPYHLDNASDALCVAPMGENLFIIARHDDDNYEPLLVTPFEKPTVEHDAMKFLEHPPKGRKVGQIKVDKKTSKRLRFEIVGGNPKEAFTIHPTDGSIYVNNPEIIDAKLHPVFNLEVRINTNCFKPVVKVPIHITGAIPMDLTNLKERFLFYPDFNRQGYLMTTMLDEGDKVYVYTQDFQMIDELIVRNKSVHVSGYPAATYMLNSRNNRHNYYQKVELK
jgi:hypothetical protein